MNDLKTGGAQNDGRPTTFLPRCKELAWACAGTSTTSSLKAKTFQITVDIMILTVHLKNNSASC